VGLAFELVLGEDLVDRKLEDFVEALLLLRIELQLAEVAHQPVGHGVPEGSEAARELDVLVFVEVLLVGLEVEPPALVHPLADEFDRRLRVVLLFLW